MEGKSATVETSSSEVQSEEPAVVTAASLLEEVSIDGMCGVY